MSEAVNVQLKLPDHQALALAQLVKRLTWRDIRECAVDDTEAYVMVDALAQVGRALADQGFAPR